jgi:hypothetical protein
MRDRVAVAGLVAFLLSANSAVSSPSRAHISSGDRDELKQLMAEDQADRQSKSIDWEVVAPRDRARLARVRALYASGALHTANDRLLLPIPVV